MINLNSQLRPPREHWAVGPRRDRAFDFRHDAPTGTQDLLQWSSSIPAQGVQAEYRFQRDCQEMEGPGLGQMTRTALQGSATWAVMGAMAGCLAAGLGFAGALLPATLGGAAIGAGLEPLLALKRQRQYPIEGECVPGRLFTQSDGLGTKQLFFEPQGGRAPVNLMEFAQAPQTPGGEPGEVYSPERPWWSNPNTGQAYI